MPLNQSQDEKDIKLLVLDIDGTIAGQSNTLSHPVKEVIAAVQAKGIKVAIATGRMYCSALRFHQEIGSTLPLVAYQGAWIQDPNTQEIHRHLSVSREIALQLLEYFEQPDLRSLLSVHFYINDQLYVREITKETEEFSVPDIIDGRDPVECNGTPPPGYVNVENEVDGQRVLQRESFDSCRRRNKNFF